MTEVSRRLGIGRSTLYRKLKDLGIADGGENGIRQNSRFRVASPIVLQVTPEVSDPEVTLRRRNAAISFYALI